jgi:hypothetical protein
MHRNFGIDLETQLHGSTANIEDPYHEQALEPVRAADHDSLLTFSR